MIRPELEIAAFWEHFVCIDCGADAEHSSPTCLECGSPNWVPAQTLLSFVEGLDTPEEEG